MTEEGRYGGGFAGVDMCTAKARKIGMGGGGGPVLGRELCGGICRGAEGPVKGRRRDTGIRNMEQGSSAVGRETAGDMSGGGKSGRRLNR